MSLPSTSHSVQQSTRRAILLTSLFNEPLWTLYGLLAFILHKDLGASAFQITLLTLIRPLVSLFSMYWCAQIAQRRDALRSNLFWAGILARVPFLLFLFFDSSWFFIFAAALYMLFYRAGTPAWMEILKLNLPKQLRERSFAQGSTLGYGAGLLVGLLCGICLDHGVFGWKILFVLAGLISLCGVYVQRNLPIEGEEQVRFEQHTAEMRPLEVLTAPWKDALHLMRTRRDFAKFQWGFMACGLGIMLLQPALPFFFIDTLHLSYTDLTLAFSLCKGVGYVLSSSLWARAMHRMALARLAAAVFLFFALFPLLLLGATLQVVWLYLAYVVYGVAQAGSHLIWNLSGPIFSQGDDSSRYTSVNIVMVGVRGLVAPPLGGQLAALVFGPVVALIVGMLLCFLGSWVMFREREKRLTAP